MKNKNILNGFLVILLFGSFVIEAHATTTKEMKDFLALRNNMNYSYYPNYDNFNNELNNKRAYRKIKRQQKLNNLKRFSNNLNNFIQSGGNYYSNPYDNGTMTGYSVPIQSNTLNRTFNNFEDNKLDDFYNKRYNSYNNYNSIPNYSYNINNTNRLNYDPNNHYKSFNSLNNNKINPTTNNEEIYSSQDSGETYYQDGRYYILNRKTGMNTGVRIIYD